MGSIEITNSINSFALELLDKLVSSDEGNVVISPISVANAMAMAAAGATQGSTNAQELENVLRLPITSEKGANQLGKALVQMMSTDPKVQIVLANSQWTNGTILESFKEGIRRDYDAEVFQLPSTPDPINSWVKEKTDSLIEKIIDQIDPLVVAILVNAIYFKGEWQSQFDADETQIDSFYITPKQDIGVQMMHRTDKKMYYTRCDFGPEVGDVQVAELPYGTGEHFSAVILLPDAREGAT
eukprot:gene29771-37128_t